MKIFVIPSWYPTPDQPYTGIFIKEHALGLAESFPDSQIAISLWGSHHEMLLLEAKTWYKAPYKLLRAGRKHCVKNLLPNCSEILTPAFTWTRKIRKGNIGGIVKANEANLLHFIGLHGKPDIIHAYVAHPAGFIAMELGQKYKIPYVITEEMSPFPMPAYGKPGQLSHWLINPYRHSSANIAVSQSLSKKMENEQVSTRAVIPNFIDEDFFSPASFSVTQIKNFLFIGRLEEQKGVDILLRAFQMLTKDEASGIELWIGGNGSECKTLKKQARNLGVEGKIRWLGMLSRDQVKHYIEASDAFVLPSRHESFGIVVAEAMAMGKPVIGTICGGPEEIITSECGLLVEPGNVDQLCAAMAKLMITAHAYDPKTIRKSCLERYSKKVVTGKIVNLYEEVIANYSQKLNKPYPHP